MSKTLATEIDLDRFCGTDGPYPLSKPFVKDGYRYATDGGIAIRVPAQGEPDTEGSFPPCPDLFKPTDAPRRQLPVTPEYQSLGMEMECPQCGGMGTVFQAVEFEDFIEADDEETECLYCFGIGKGNFPFLVNYGETNIQKKYDVRIRELPGPIKYAESLAGKQLRFWFDGGEVVLMGFDTSRYRGAIKWTPDPAMKAER